MSPGPRANSDGTSIIVYTCSEMESGYIVCKTRATLQSRKEISYNISQTLGEMLPECICRNNINVAFCVRVTYRFQHAFLAKRQGASAKSCMSSLLKSYSFLDSPEPSRSQSTGGTVLNTYTSPRQRGPAGVSIQHENSKQAHAFSCSQQSLA